MNQKKLNRRIKLPGGGKQTGALLIESMVAIAVFSIALLSLSGLQLTSSKASLSSAMRTQSAIASSQIIDMMRSNLVGVNADEYDFDYGDTLPIGTTAIQAELDILQWLTNLGNSGLKGVSPEGQIACNAVTLKCQIGVRWQDDRAGLIGQDQTVTAADTEFEYLRNINL